MITSRSMSLATMLVAISTVAFAQQKPAAPRPQPDPMRTTAKPEPKNVPVQRLHVELDGIYHAATQTLSDRATPTVHAEAAQLTADYDVPAGAGFSGGATFRLWRNLGVGATVSMFSTSFPANVTGSIPYPFAFNRPRTFEGSVSDLERKEVAIGIHLRGLFQVSPKFTISAFAGPARLTVTQDVVTAIQYAEAYPYETATFSAAAIGTDKVNKWGVSAGADVAYYFMRNVGIGVGAKFNGGEAELVSLGSAPLTSKLGGAEFGGGLRLRF